MWCLPLRLAQERISSAGNKDRGSKWSSFADGIDGRRDSQKIAVAQKTADSALAPSGIRQSVCLCRRKALKKVDDQ